MVLGFLVLGGLRLSDHDLDLTTRLALEDGSVQGESNGRAVHPLCRLGFPWEYDGERVRRIVQNQAKVQLFQPEIDPQTFIQPLDEPVEGLLYGYDRDNHYWLWVGKSPVELEAPIQQLLEYVGVLTMDGLVEHGQGPGGAVWRQVRERSGPHSLRFDPDEDEGNVIKYQKGIYTVESGLGVIRLHKDNLRLDRAA